MTTKATNGMLAFDGGALSGFRNYLINGNMAIDQRNRGAAYGLLGVTTVYALDRWATRHYIAAAAAGTQSVQRVAGDAQSRYAVRLLKFAGTSVNSIGICQVIETANCYGLAGKTVTLSYRARKGSTYAAGTQVQVSLITGTGTDQSPEQAVNATWTGTASQNTSSGNLTTTFQSFTNTFTVPNGTTEIAVMLRTDVFSSATGDANNYLDITDVQLEIGTAPEPFEFRFSGTELSLCQRYYYRTGYTYQNSLGQGVCYTTTQAITSIKFPTSMRITPSLETSGTASDYLILTGGAQPVCNAVPTFSTASTEEAVLNATVASGLVVGQAFILRAATANAYIGFNAEI